MQISVNKSSDTIETRKHLLALFSVKTRKNEKIIPRRFFINTIKKLTNYCTLHTVIRNAMKEKLANYPILHTVFGNALKEKLAKYPKLHTVI